MARKKPIETTISNKEESLAKRQQALDTLFANMSQQGGIVAGRPTVSQAVKDRLTFKFFKTPIPELNEAIGGGIPVGKMTLIAGNPDSGKTGCALSIIGYQQKIDPNFIALWVESEDSLDVEKAAKLYGLDLDRFYSISTTDPKTKSQVFGAEAIGNAIVAAIKSTKIDMVVINSLKMLVPMVETNKTLNEETVATQARYNARLVKKLIPLIAQKETALIIVQHYTTSMSAGPYGNPNLIAGGKAIRYNNMVTLEFGSLTLQDNDPVKRGEGMKIHVRVTKNHCVIDRNPNVDFTYYIEYGKGIERYITTLNQLIAKGILVTAGAWIYLLDADGNKDPEMSWCGKNKFKEDMIANPVKFDTLCALLDGQTGAVNDMSEEEIKELEEQEAALDAEMEKAGIEKVDANVVPEDDSE